MRTRFKLLWLVGRQGGRRYEHTLAGTGKYCSRCLVADVGETFFSTRALEKNDTASPVYYCEGTAAMDNEEATTKRLQLPDNGGISKGQRRAG